MMYGALLVFAVCIVFSIHLWNVYDRVHEVLPGFIRDEPSTEYEIIEGLKLKGISIGPRMLYAVAKSLEAVIVIEEIEDDSDAGVSVIMRYRRRKLSDSPVVTA